ncbi:hypothetical protein BH09SUM1_BH09SUM1_25060 [soil metagenome]
MKKALLAVALIVLVLVGVAAAMLFIDPVGTQQMLGMSSAGDTEDNMVQHPRTRGAHQDSEVAAAPAAPEPAAAAGGRRPPRRADMPAAVVETDVKDSTATKTVSSMRKGRYIGAADGESFMSPPPAELYPFRVTKTTYPDADTINVEITISNASGSQWKTAYVLFRSSKYPVSQQFEIADWQIDESIALNYSFPVTQVQDRILDLRVVSVSGDKRQSALADRLSQSRRRYIDLTNSTREASAMPRAGDKLTAPGLLAVLASLQSPITGIGIEPAELRTVAETKAITVKISADKMISDDYPSEVRETSQERQAAAQLASKYHAAGVEAQLALNEFVDNLGRKPYQEAMAGEAGQALETLRTKLKAFNDLGAELALVVQRSSDSEIKKAGNVLNSDSAKLVAQMDEIEKTVRRIDQHFTIQKD